MAGDTPKSWREIRRQRTLNERRVEVYRRLMEAEERLDDVRRRRGLSDTLLGDIIEQTDPDDAGDDDDTSAVFDVYLTTVVRYVAALGGHVEVRAVFPEETITLLGGA